MKTELIIFSIPKPFTGKTKTIQENAIKSWKKLQENVEIVLFGDDFGVEQACKDFELIHCPDVKKNNFGTPFLDDVFKKAKIIACEKTECYINTDIIVTEDFGVAIDKVLENKKINKNDYLIVGGRIDFNLSEDGVFNQQLADEVGEKHQPWGSDFFIFSGKSKLKMPRFLVGRPYWDNWLIGDFLEKYLPVIDISEFCLVYHQNHDYSHIKKGTGNQWLGPESNYTHSLFKKITNKATPKNLTDTNYKLNKSGKLKCKKILFRLKLNYKSILNLKFITPVVSLLFFLGILSLNDIRALIFYILIQYIIFVQTYAYIVSNRNIIDQHFKTRMEISRKENS
jgi:hypothetical protein